MIWHQALVGCKVLTRRLLPRNSYDFSYLFKEHGVSVQARRCACGVRAWQRVADRAPWRAQIGGSDQWGNITAGTDLIRRVQQREGAIGAAAALPAWLS